MWVTHSKLLGEFYNYFALFNGSIVFHFSIEHDGASSVTHCVDHALSLKHVLWPWAKDALCDINLYGVQTPRTNATEQVGIANDVWAPSEAEVEHARKVIAAFDEALAAGKGVVQLDGKMIENLHVANAQRAIAIADAIAALN